MCKYRDERKKMEKKNVCNYSLEYNNRSKKYLIIESRHIFFCKQRNDYSLVKSLDLINWFRIVNAMPSD